MKLKLLDGLYAVIRLDADAEPPQALRGAAGLVCVTRTDGELSILCPQEFAAGYARAQRGLRAIKVNQPLDFAMTGVLASLAVPLAEAGVPIFALSTFDTDYVLVPADKLDAAQDALIRAGHTFSR